MSRQTVALVGGTGRLGRLIGSAVLDKPGVQLRLLVRPGRREDVRVFEERGAEVVEGALGPHADAVLASFCRGAWSVVSAVQGGADVLVDGQRQLLRVAREAGVKRFIPSDYSLDFFKVKPGRLPTSERHRVFASIAAAERGDVEVVHVLNGGFIDRGMLIDFLRVIDLRERTAYVWGDGKQLMHWTTRADTARYTAEIAIDERPVPRIFSVAGDVLDFIGVVRSYEFGSGKRLHIERRGSLEALDARIERLEKAGPANFLSYFPLMCYRAFLTGEGKLDELMNDRYPSIRTTTILEHVMRGDLERAP